MLKSLGVYVRERRQDLGLTQEQLAERVGDGVRQAEISRLESGRVMFPRRERLIALANALEVSMGDLLLKAGWIEERHLLELEYPRLPAATTGQYPEALMTNAVKDLSVLMDTLTTGRARLNEMSRVLEEVEETIAAVLATFNAEIESHEHERSPNRTLKALRAS